MSGSASWCFIAKAFRRANDELERRKVRSLEYYGETVDAAERRTCWPFEWPCCRVDGWKGEEEQFCAV